MLGEAWAVIRVRGKEKFSRSANELRGSKTFVSLLSASTVCPWDFEMVTPKQVKNIFQYNNLKPIGLQMSFEMVQGGSQSDIATICKKEGKFSDLLFLIHS